MYTRIGYRKRELGEYAISDAKAVINHIGAEKYQYMLPEAVDSIGHPRTKLDQLSLSDVLQSGNEKNPVRSSSPIFRQWTRLLLAVLNNAGLVKEDVDVYEYRLNPILTMDELMTRMLDEHVKAALPNLAQLGGTNATISTFRNVMPRVLRDLEYIDSLRVQTLVHLRRGVSNIAFKMRTGQQVTQFEKTFFLLGCDTSADRSGFSDAGTPTPIIIAESADPLMLKALARAEAVTSAGPYLRYQRLISNRDREYLVAYYGPQISTLPLSIGRLLNRGPFFELVFERLDDRPWTPESQMAGIRDRIALPTVANGKSVDSPKDVKGDTTGCPSPVGLATIHRTNADGTGKVTPFILDLPEIKITPLDEADCRFYRWEYPHTYWNRIITGGFGHDAQPDDVLFDYAMKVTEIGDNVVEAANLDHVKLLDAADILETRRVKVDELKDKVFFVRKGKFSEDEIDMRHFYYRYGKDIFRPALSEFVMPPIAWLHVPNDSAVQYLSTRLNLNREESLQNMRVLTVCHNYAEIQRLIGNAPEVNLRSYVMNMLGL
jgi:hypothetical protein